MAILKAKDARKMSKKDLDEKMKELRFEIVRAAVTANKQNAKTKELKRTLSRCINISKTLKEATKQ